MITEKKNDREYYLAGDPVLVKDRRRSKNLLHRLNITEYRITKKAREIIKELIPNAGANLYIEPPFVITVTTSTETMFSSM
jgi:maltose O-acetyltransferase